MGRIRTVKPELFTHEDLYALERETGLPVRLSFVGLFTVCDREGRFKWEPNRIKLAVLPYDSVDFSRVLDALTTRGMVVKYSVDAKDYGYLPTFNTHQVINNRESPSVLPEPNEINCLDASSTRAARVDHASGTPLKHAQGEGKGKEGKGSGKEREGAKRDVEPTGPTPGFRIPEWVPADAWQGYLDMRKAKKKVPTERAIQLVIADLEKFRAAGHDLVSILNTSIKNAWTDVYAPRIQAAAGGPHGVNEKFNFSHLDRSGDARAAEESRRRQGIETPSPDEEIDI